VIYIGSYDGIHAINKDGSQKWILDLGGVTVHSCPAVVGGTIYVGSLDGNVYAITKDGQIKWRYKTGSAVYSSPAVVNDGTTDVVYIGSSDGKVYAIKADGSLKWAFQTGGAVSSSPAVAGGVVYVASYDGRIYAIDAATGNPYSGWSTPFQTGGRGLSSPAAVNGVVYVGGCGDFNIYAIDAMTGSQKWAFRTGGYVFSSPAVVNGVVYVGSYDGKLYAIDAITGNQLWTYQTGGSVHSSPAFANGVVYVGSSDHKIYAIDVRPVADFTFTSPTLEAPLTVQFTDTSKNNPTTSTDNPTSWIWNFGDYTVCVKYSSCGSSGKLGKLGLNIKCNGLLSIFAKNPSHTYPRAGTYTVTHTASNFYGGESLPVQKTVTITGCPIKCSKFPWCEM
jgi:outer membrane protein assembly factor BamB